MRFQAVWPVADPATPAVALFEEAAEDLPRVARRHRAVLHGRPVFTVHHAADVPGCGQATGLVVVARCWASVMPRPDDRAAIDVTPAA